MTVDADLRIFLTSPAGHVIGAVAGAWAAWYGTERALLEVLRLDYDRRFFSSTTARLVGLAIAVVSPVAFALRHRTGILPPLHEPEPASRARARSRLGAAGFEPS